MDGPVIPMPQKIAVAIPSYKVRDHILGVIARIGAEVWRIYVIDDCCPDGSGDYVEQYCQDRRVRVLRNLVNQGVGGAVMTGYCSAIDDGADVVVKIDGDGQMPPELIPLFVSPILAGEADYTKGNRFYNIEDVRSMPTARLLGNAGLSFLTKLSSGYWTIFDPTNGYTAIHTALLRVLPLEKINKGYFFESDMLFRLNTFRAKVIDIPMRAVYAEEESSLHIRKVALPFLFHNLRNMCKRILYNYFLRDFSVASLELLFGIMLFIFGLVFGSLEWVAHMRQNKYASTGTVMLSVLPIITGMQLLISFVNYDVSSVPDRPVHDSLAYQAESRISK